MNLVARIKHDVISIIPAVIYFMIIFNTMHIISNLALKPGAIPYYSAFTVTLWGLIAGKVILIVNALPFIDLFPNKPLIYNIVWKLFLYSLAALLFRMLDILLHEAYRFDSWVYAWQRVEHVLHKPLFWSLQLFLMMTLLAFVIFNEFVRVLGREQMVKMLFGASSYR